MTEPRIVPYGQDGFIESYGAVWSARNGRLLGEFFAEDGAYIESAYGNSYVGRERIGRFVRFMHAFSDEVLIEYTSHCGTHEGFALEWTWSGIATGPIRIHDKVFPATHKRYRVPGIALCRANAEGRITYHRDYYDLMTLMRQIGLGDTVS